MNQAEQLIRSHLGKVKAVVDSLEWKEFRAAIDISLRETFLRCASARTGDEALSACSEARALMGMVNKLEGIVPVLERSLKLATLEADHAKRQDMQKALELRRTAPYSSPEYTRFMESD